MITSVDSVYHMTFSMQFYRLQSLFISMKICIVVKDIVMMLLVPAESVMYCVFIALFMIWR